MLEDCFGRPALASLNPPDARSSEFSYPKARVADSVPDH